MRLRRAAGIFAGLFLYSVAARAGARDSTAVLEPVVHVYASPEGVGLKAYVFEREPPNPERRRPAVVLFHGGGWVMGEAEWVFPTARHYAERGMVTIAVQYRLSDRREITPLEAMADARMAIRWIRGHADSLGIAPDRIAAYGWSAGGHLAACAAIFDTVGPGETIGSAPDALILVSPAVALGADGWVQGLLGRRANAKEISPDEHVRNGLPPTLILQGDVDTVTPLDGARRFCERLRAAGNACELHVYDGFGHLFTPTGIPDYGWPQPDSAASADASAHADRFLDSLGFGR